MLIASSGKWRADTLTALQAENPVLDCPFCTGLNVAFPGCPDCDFEGEFHALDATDRAIEVFVSQKAYQEQVISDLKTWCAYTRQDFLMAVGPFIQGFRAGALGKHSAQ
jgi:hypothetical protein